MSHLRQTTSHTPVPGQDQPPQDAGSGDNLQRELDRTEELFAQRRWEVCVATDRLFVLVMLLQFLGGVLIARHVSPWTWLGQTPHVDLHVWMALLLGAGISIPAIASAVYRPGHTSTRHLIGICQVAWSALLIHLSGGRIEAHFHVFGSLAFLAFYRDWRVIVSATAFVAADHFLRGMWFPQSVYGVAVASPFRWLEHLGWVVFEDIFLIISSVRAHRELKLLCQRQAQLEGANCVIEKKVETRTAQLQQANNDLRHEMAERQAIEQEREELTKQLMSASRDAGMAEIATGVLHNVGNVLTSVTVSCDVIAEKMRASRIQGLARAIELLRQHEHELTQFLTVDRRGQQLPKYLGQVTETLAEEQQTIFEEVECLRDNIEHISEIISMQQSYARIGQLVQQVEIPDLVRDALRMNDASLRRHDVEVVVEADDVPPCYLDKHRALQILVNLVSNAKQAVSVARRERPMVRIRAYQLNAGEVAIEVIDNGIGIARENLKRIFSHGFTTKPKGHGFGLHSAANSAAELGGSLQAESNGLGHGAKFRLTVPIGTRQEQGEPLPV